MPSGPSFELDNEDAPARLFLEANAVLSFPLSSPCSLTSFFLFSRLHRSYASRFPSTYLYLTLLGPDYHYSEGCQPGPYPRVSINLVNRTASSFRPERELQRWTRGAGKRWSTITSMGITASLRCCFSCFWFARNYFGITGAPCIVIFNYFSQSLNI